MNSNDTRSQGRRQGRGGRRPSNNRQRDNRGGRNSYRQREERQTPAKKLSFWQKIVAFFTRKPASQSSPSRSDRPRNTETREQRETRAPRAKPEPVEVTSTKLYVGNLSYDCSESDLFDLFKGVGQVQNAEVVTHKGTYKSKGFGFVTMLTIDEAKRAVETLHDQPFMGRKLVVNGSRSTGPRDFSEPRE
jgi:RNA recognition motif-containing protein